jgi:hypothetical protein
MTRLRWVASSGKLNVASLGYRPVESGCKSLNGAPLYIVEAPHNEAVHPGKASEDVEGMHLLNLFAIVIKSEKKRCVHCIRWSGKAC